MRTRLYPSAPARVSEEEQLTPRQRTLLARLDHLLRVAAPAAASPARRQLVAHAIRHALTECERAGLAARATERLRRAGRATAMVS
jgi:hypothetical protein